MIGAQTRYTYMSGSWYKTQKKHLIALQNYGKVFLLCCHTIYCSRFLKWWRDIKSLNNPKDGYKALRQVWLHYQQPRHKLGCFFGRFCSTPTQWRWVGLHLWFWASIGKLVTLCFLNSEYSVQTAKILSLSFTIIFVYVEYAFYTKRWMNNYLYAFMFQVMLLQKITHFFSFGI